MQPPSPLTSREAASVQPHPWLGITVPLDRAMGAIACYYWHTPCLSHSFAARIRNSSHHSHHGKQPQYSHICGWQSSFPCAGKREPQLVTPGKRRVCRISFLRKYSTVVTTPITRGGLNTATSLVGNHSPLGPGNGSYSALLLAYAVCVASLCGANTQPLSPLPSLETASSDGKHLLE